MIIDSLYMRLRGRYGILTGLLEDPLINEIMVNGPERIYVEREKALVRVDDAFTSCEELEEMIRMFASDVHREINEANPIVDARLPSGFRVNGVLRNVALNGPILTIRKFREKEIEMDELVGCASLSRECAEDLAALVRSGYNIFISGGTSSGKTTGASLITALGKAAGVIMEKMSIDREIEELVRRKESEGIVIFAMPALIILFLNLTAPDYIAPLYETVAGRVIMTAVLASNIGIYAMIQRITNVEI